MIKYTLKCEDGHGFESWFASAAAYDSLHASGLVACAQCGSVRVDKAIMAPRVSTDKAEAHTPPPAEQGPAVSPGDVENALKRMRAEVEKNATYVGGNFAREARDMYLGNVPDRPIWGEANAREARALVEDGVPVVPLPFVPTRKVN